MQNIVQRFPSHKSRSMRSRLASRVHSRCSHKTFPWYSRNRLRMWMQARSEMRWYPVKARVAATPLASLLRKSGRLCRRNVALVDTDDCILATLTGILRHSNGSMLDARSVCLAGHRCQLTRFGKVLCGSSSQPYVASVAVA